VLGYLADETERRAIGRQQNKGESLHALHDRTFHGNHGTVRLHTLERQSTQAHCLHLVANAIVYWNTIYIQRAVDALGYEPAGDELAGLTPTIFEHVNPLALRGEARRGSADAQGDGLLRRSWPLDPCLTRAGAQGQMRMGDGCRAPR
jgi:hypothetical protein